MAGGDGRGCCPLRPMHGLPAAASAVGGAGPGAGGLMREEAGSGQGHPGTEAWWPRIWNRPQGSEQGPGFGGGREGSEWVHERGQDQTAGLWAPGSYGPHGLTWFIQSTCSHMLSQSQSPASGWGKGSLGGPLRFSEKQGASASPHPAFLSSLLWALRTQHTRTPQKDLRVRLSGGLGLRHTGMAG